MSDQNQQTNYQQQAPQGYSPYQQYDPYDHTAEFTAEDISENKVFAMICYLVSGIGIIIALLAAQKSPYAMFHVRQAAKFLVFDILLAIVCVVLCWTIIVPIAYGIMTTALWIIKIIAVFQIASGKAKEPAIIKSLGFLK